jgi:hypothetical protein
MRPSALYGAVLLVFGLFCLVGCGPSEEQKRETQRSEKLKADLEEEKRLLSDPSRAKAELIKRLRASVKMRDGLLTVDPLAAFGVDGFSLFVLSPNSPWLVHCGTGTGIEVVFGASVSGTGEEVDNDIKISLARAAIPEHGCEMLGPAIGKEIQAIINGG